MHVIAVILIHFKDGTFLKEWSIYIGNLNEWVILFTLDKPSE